MISAILLILFLFFFLNNLAGRNTDLAAPVYVTSAIAFTFAIPLLSMRSFAEETRNKTDQLYMTAPITIGQVVLGKFLAIATLLAIPTGIACLLPVLMRLFSRDVQLLNCYTSLLAFYLYALMLTSICLFFSTFGCLFGAVYCGWHLHGKCFFQDKNYLACENSIRCTGFQFSYGNDDIQRYL